MRLVCNQTLRLRMDARIGNRMSSTRWVVNQEMSCEKTMPGRSCDYLLSIILSSSSRPELFLAHSMAKSDALRNFLCAYF